MKRVGMKRVVCELWFFLTVDIQKWNLDNLISKTEIKFCMLKQGCMQKHSRVERYFRCAFQRCKGVQVKGV